LDPVEIIKRNENQSLKNSRHKFQVRNREIVPEGQKDHENGKDDEEEEREIQKKIWRKTMVVICLEPP
jgi:hypothetical protein